MDAPALCDSILQFVGSGLPAEGSASNLPATGVAGEAAEKRVSEGGTSRDTLGDDAERTGSYAASGATEQQLQKQGLMRAFMGNKLGEFNMRGVEAGMGMVKVANRKAGKLLNSGRRHRREEQSTPYGRRSSSCEEKKKPMATHAEQPQAADAQPASTEAASSQAAGPATSRPGSAVGGVVGSVGTASSCSLK